MGGLIDEERVVDGEMARRWKVEKRKDWHPVTVLEVSYFRSDGRNHPCAIDTKDSRVFLDCEAIAIILDLDIFK